MVSSLNSSGADLEMFGPMGCAQGFSVECNPYCVSSIKYLLLHRGPRAIGWAVFLAVIFAFYCVLRGGAWPHVFIEVGKVIPPLANPDASLAVILIAFTIGVIASCSYVFPHAILWRFREAVPQTSGAESFLGNTATALRVPPSQVICRCDGAAATVASAEPVSALAGAFNIFNGRQAAKLGAGNINGCSHGVIVSATGANVKCGRWVFL